MDANSLPLFSIWSLAGFKVQTVHSFLLGHLSYGFGSSNPPNPSPTTSYSDTLHPKEAAGSTVIAHHNIDISGSSSQKSLEGYSCFCVFLAENLQ